MNRLTMLCIVGSVAICSGASGQKPQDVSNLGRTTLSFSRTPSEEIKISILIKPASPVPNREWDIYSQQPAMHFGRVQEDGRTVDSIEVNWARADSFMLTASAISDLYNLNTAWLDMKGENLILHLTGGDGAGGYKASIELAPYGTVEKRIFSPITGYEERIEYRYPRRIVKANKNK